MKEKFSGNDKILQLYPLPVEEIPLTGAYLAHDLRKYAENMLKPFVYTSFISSLDGRISIPHPGGSGFLIPKTIANDRDWRLFQELAMQSDIILSSGRYLRELAGGKVKEIIRVDDPMFKDLRQWRESRDLPPYPDIAVLTRNLDFSVPPQLMAGGSKVLVFTGSVSDAKQAVKKEAQGIRIYNAGENGVDGRVLMQLLEEMGYRTVFSSAGPQVLHLLLASGMLDRLYLSIVSQLIAGEQFISILAGHLLDPEINLSVNHIYLDLTGLQGPGQIFISCNVA